MDCAVCGDSKDIKQHYGVPTCFGCKAFFRRTIVEKKDFRCQFHGVCTISKKNRNHCKGCRFRKCLAVGMDTEMLREDRKTATRPQDSAIEAGPSTSSNTRALDFLDFLVKIEENVMSIYDSDYEHVDAEVTEKLNEIYGRSLSLEDALLRPELVCPRTKMNWKCEREMVDIDMAFCWFRSFTYITDWSMSIPQFKQMSSADQANLFRQNFAALTWVFFLPVLIKNNFLLGLPIGNGSYIPFHGESHYLGMSNQRSAMLLKAAKNMIETARKQECDLAEVVIIKGLMLFQNEFAVSEKGRKSCEEMRSLLLDALWEYQQKKFPARSASELAKRQGQLLLLIAIVEQLWHFESDSHVVMNVFNALDLSGVIIELITHASKEEAQETRLPNSV